jgi:hypothetical protein
MCDTTSISTFDISHTRTNIDTHTRRPIEELKLIVMRQVVNWIQLDLDRVRWRDHVNNVGKLLVP